MPRASQFSPEQYTAALKGKNRSATLYETVAPHDRHLAGQYALDVAPREAATADGLSS